MNSLSYLSRNITFRESSVITGRWDSSKYRFLERPATDLSNPAIRRMVIYKAASCMGTVFLQCALTYRIERELGHGQVVTQTDEHAGMFTVKRGKPFVLRIPGVEALIPKNAKGEQKLYAITNTHWNFVHKWIKICGPGESHQQSEQVRWLFTDESHLVDSFPDGALTAFEKRMGNAWNRASLHVTTAADKGREVDKFYHEGGQNEFHLRCLNCHELFWPLWEDDAKAKYGKTLFRWLEWNTQEQPLTESEILDTLRLHCPHCDHAHQDTMQTRHDLQTHGDYVAMNPGALPENQSYRWNCFAYYPISWREVLTEWLRALRAERMGDLKPMEDFVKKRLCMSYVPTLHNMGETSSGRDYKSGDVWIVDERLCRTGSFDVQSESGFHLWAQCDDFRADGSSRRVAFTRLESWAQARQFQLDHNIESEHVGIDTQHRHAETLARCAEWLWYGMRASDEREFLVSVDGKKVPNRFYVDPTLEDAMQGKSIAPDIARLRKRTHFPVVKTPTGIVHTGFCFVRAWSKQNVGMLLMRLKDGSAGRYFGVATDLSDDFTEQLHSYIETRETHKKTGAESVVLKQIKHHDHAFSCQSQSIVLAMVAGCFPLG